MVPGSDSSFHARFRRQPSRSATSPAPEPFVCYFSEKIAGLAEQYDLRSQIWIQGFRLPAGSSDEARIATRTAIESGVDSVMLWGYDGCKSIFEITCEEPEDVWQAYLEEVQTARE